MAEVAVVGLGKLGACLAAVLADAGHRVHGVDLHARTVNAVNAGRAPVDETGLADLLSSLRPGQLTATNDYEEAVGEAEMTFVVVPTPSLPNGWFDPAAVLAAGIEVNRWAKPGHVLVICSTVMPGTMNALAKVAPDVALAYSPEFVALGSVLTGMRNPDMVLIGAENPVVHERVWSVLVDVSGRSSPFVARLSLANAEIAKLAVNGYLTTKVAFCNALAGACEEFPGADAAAVLEAVGHDHRIGHSFLRAGTPPGGACLPRDAVALSAFLRHNGSTPALSEAVTYVSHRQVEDTVALFGAMHNRVAILGLAFKVGTPVWERSFGVEVAERLVQRGIRVIGHDPLARPTHIALAATAAEAVAEADAVLVATAWESYRELDVGGRPTLDMWGVLPDQPGVRRFGRNG